MDGWIEGKENSIEKDVLFCSLHLQIVLDNENYSIWQAVRHALLTLAYTVVPCRFLNAM